MDSRTWPRTTPSGKPSPIEQLGSRLDSWKEIAAYLGRSEKTARRWEDREELPVHRLHHEKASSVYAYTNELDAWLQMRKIPDSLRSVPKETLNKLPTQEVNACILETSDTSTGPTTSLNTRTPFGGRRWSIAASGIFAGLVLIAAYWAWSAKRNTIGQVTSISPVTTYPGDESEPSLSPDGRQVAFSWGGERGDNRDIYVTLLGEQHPLRLTTDPSGDGYPAWSPDGKHIAFIRRLTGTQAEIILVSALGGPERILRRIRLGAWITGRMLAWSPNGKWLCFTTETGTSGHHVLFLLSPDSGAIRELLPERDNGVGDSSPAFSPDGRWLAFGRFIFPSRSELLLQRLSPDLRPEGAPLIVKDGGVNPKAPVWTSDGKRVFFLEGARIMQAEIGSPARQLYVSSSRFTELALTGSAARPRLRNICPILDWRSDKEPGAFTGIRFPSTLGRLLSF